MSYDKILLMLDSRSLTWKKLLSNLDEIALTKAVQSRTLSAIKDDDETDVNKPKKHVKANHIKLKKETEDNPNRKGDGDTAPAVVWSTNNRCHIHPKSANSHTNGMCKTQSEIRRQGKSLSKMLPDLTALLKKRKDYEAKSSKTNKSKPINAGHHIKARPDSCEDDSSLQSSISSKGDTAEMKDYESDKSDDRSYQSESSISDSDSERREMDRFKRSSSSKEKQTRLLSR